MTQSEYEGMDHTVGEQRKNRAGAAMSFKDCSIGDHPIPNGGIFASLEQVANTFDDDAPEGLAMAHTVRGVLAEVTDMQVGAPMLAGPVTLMAGTTGAFRIADVEGVEYEVFVRKHTR